MSKPHKSHQRRKLIINDRLWSPFSPTAEVAAAKEAQAEKKHKLSTYIGSKVINSGNLVKELIAEVPEPVVEDKGLLVLPYFHRHKFSGRPNANAIIENALQEVLKTTERTGALNMKLLDPVITQNRAGNEHTVRYPFAIALDDSLQHDIRYTNELLPKLGDTSVTTTILRVFSSPSEADTHRAFEMIYNHGLDEAVLGLPTILTTPAKS